MKTRLALLFSTALYIGFIPGAPGTYGSLATTAVLFFLLKTGHQILPDLHLSAVGMISILGIVSAAETSRVRKDEDPSIVVIDEVAGQLLTYLFVPLTVVNLVIGFLLFRLFDIWKPQPVRKLESLKNGVGIMADDLAAGIYANVLLQAISWLATRHFHWYIS
jgi:phosphatidylglycerophosphatase A